MLNNPANSAAAGSVAATFATQNFSFTFSPSPNTTYYYRIVFLPLCSGSAFQTGNVVSQFPDIDVAGAMFKFSCNKRNS